MSAIFVAFALLYAAVTLAAGNDSPKRGESGFLDNLQVGQTLVLVERETGLYAIFMDRNATAAEFQKTTKRLTNPLTLDYRRVTKVTDSFVELRGKNPIDLTTPDGFENVIFQRRFAFPPAIPYKGGVGGFWESLSGVGN